MESIVIFAAGKGTRMKEITNTIPKPLIKINGKPLLQHALEFTKQYKFDRIIINTHHLSSQINEFIKRFREDNLHFSEIIIEHEPVLLETGGTIKKLYELYNLEERIFTLNSDVIIKAESNVFQDMINMWNKQNPDMLLLLQSTDKALGYIGNGDFNLEVGNKITRDGAKTYPYMFSGLQILKPQKISEYPGDIFSLQEYFPPLGTMSSRVDIRAFPMEGWWYHATRPEDVKEIEQSLILLNH